MAEPWGGIVAVAQPHGWNPRLRDPIAMTQLARALLPLLLLTGPVAACPAPRLTEWLAALPEARLARDDPSFLAWRRKHPDLVQRLVAPWSRHRGSPAGG